MKNRRRRWGWLLIVFFGLPLGAASCTWWAKTEPVPPTPQNTFAKAMALYDKKKYEKAAEGFKRFKEEFPLDALTPMAEMRTADSLYYDRKYIEAIGLYEEFKKLHPTHPEVQYVTFQVGMCHFRQMLTPDRDQTETEKAMEQFRYLIENFPQSPLVAEAKKNSETCRRQMAEHEYLIADLYYRTYKYKAALGRFESLIRNYPGTGFDEKAKGFLKECQAQVAKEELKKKEKQAQEEKKKKAAQGKQG
jgi:outer membrane protein assembly factor BamD